ncbi:MAG: alpha/beta fold hydrolase [Myxococcales bacterium]|nr:MAG: alpha/beta fold hydrolase [Myxococcales bacterium]
MAMKDWRDVLSLIGAGAAKTAMTAGRKVAEGYHAIDPDVTRHLAHVPLLSFSLFVSRREPIAPGEPDGHPPLIFVHGLGGNRGNFLLMALYLRLYGRKRSYKIHFDPGQTIEQMAVALAHFIQDVRQATGSESVDLIAHSMGGLVARLALSEPGLDGAARTLITMGAPHKGTYSARFANTEVTRALRPDSELMRRLAAMGWPKGVRGATFFSRNDLFVLPAESATAEGAEAVDATPFTHYSYLIDPRCFVKVAQALEGKTT